MELPSKKFKPNERELADLNTDCLRLIFRNLPLRDLNAANATCIQFHDIIYFSDLHKYHSTITHLNIGRALNKFFPRNALESYLKRFGRLIQEIKFCKYFFFGNRCYIEEKADEVFIFITKHCSDKLKVLRM